MLFLAFVCNVLVYNSVLRRQFCKRAAAGILHHSPRKRGGTVCLCAGGQGIGNCHAPKATIIMESPETLPRAFQAAALKAES